MSAAGESFELTGRSLEQLPKPKTMDLSQLVEQTRTTAQQQYAAWDERVFDQVCAGPVRELADALSGADQSDRVLAAYLQLVGEAIGRGYMRDAQDGVSRDSLLAHCPTDRKTSWSPAEIAAIAAEK